MAVVACVMTWPKLTGAAAAAPRAASKPMLETNPTRSPRTVSTTRERVMAFPEPRSP